MEIGRTTDDPHRVDRTLKRLPEAVKPENEKGVPTETQDHRANEVLREIFERWRPPPPLYVVIDSSCFLSFTPMQEINRVLSAIRDSVLTNMYVVVSTSIYDGISAPVEDNEIKTEVKEFSKRLGI